MTYMNSGTDETMADVSRAAQETLADANRTAQETQADVNRAVQETMALMEEASAGASHLPTLAVNEKAAATYALTRERIEGQEKVASRAWRKGDIIVSLYEVLDILGEGGFGTVYKVRHLLWNVELAVKTLRDDLALQQHHRELFIRECQGWVNLGLHPNIVTCYYIRELGGLPRIFAEYAESGSLEEWLSGDRERPLRDILRFAIQILDGLSFAHRKGLIHRDIKPANCLLAGNGTVKITDFGIASGISRLVGELSPAAASSSMTVIGSGDQVGTPAYMPPEQWEPGLGEIAPSSDIYAFGVMLFEMCCGERPFDEGGETPDIIKVRHLRSERPDPRQINKDIPLSLSQCILTCLETDQKKRYQSCDEARAVLAAIYQEVTGEPFRGGIPGDLDLKADGLNNRGVSLMDLGLREDALKSWEEALTADFLHVRATYNRGLLRWRRAEIDDMQFLDELNHIRKELHTSEDIDFFIGLVHLERDDCESAVISFEEALKKAPGSREIDEMLAKARERMHDSSRFTGTVERDPKSPGGVAAYRGISLTRDERKVCVLFSSGKVRVLDCATRQWGALFGGSEPLITAAAISPDGRYIVTGYNNGSLALLDSETGAVVKSLTGGHEKGINAVTFSPDQSFVVSGDHKTFITLWALPSGQIVRRLEGYRHLLTTTCLCFSSDGKYLLSGSEERDSFIWETATGAVVRKFTSEKSGINSAVLSSDDLRTAAIYQNEIRIWNNSNGECEKVFSAHDNHLATAITLTADGKWIISGGSDRLCRIRDTEMGRCCRSFSFGDRSVKSLVFLEKESLVAAGDDWGSVKMIHINFRRFTQSAPFALSQVKNVEELISSESRFHELFKKAEEKAGDSDYSTAINILIEAGSIPGYERNADAAALWQRLYGRCIRTGIKSVKLRHTYEGHLNPVRALAISRDGNVIVSGCWRGGLRVWNPRSSECVKVIQESGSSIECVDISEDGRLCAAGCGDSKIRIYEVESGRSLATFAGHAIKVQSLHISRDGRFLLSGSLDNTVRLWEIKSGQCLKTFTGHTNSVQVVSLSADSRWAYSGGTGGGQPKNTVLRAWDAVTGECLQILDNRTDVLSLRVTADDSQIFSGGYALTCRSRVSGEIVNKLNVNKSFNGMDISPDRKWAALSFGSSIDKDYTVKIYHIPSGKCVRVLEGHEQYVCTVRWSPDNTFIVSGGSDRKVKVWMIDWELEAPPDKEWDDGAAPYLESFLLSHIPYRSDIKGDHTPDASEIAAALTRDGSPVWNESEFRNLMKLLECVNLGWIKPEMVREKLSSSALNIDALRSSSIPVRVDETLLKKA